MRPDGEASGSASSSRPFSNGSGASPLHKVAVTKATNGTHRPPTTNGSSHANGISAQVNKSRSTWFGHDREETTRILIQALGDLGYHGAANTLSQESQFELESPTVSAFRNAVLNGEWAEAEELLFGSENSASGNGPGMVLADGSEEDLLRFWMRRQKFLEFLEERDTGQALHVLRTELTPLYQNSNQDSNELHFLASLLMCQSPEDLKAKANWAGVNGQSRHVLLSQLSKSISPSIMLPEHRLAVLLNQVKQSQISNCMYHNTAASPSLYYDHSCERKNFPLKVVLTLEKHTNEVWHVEFSHNGAYLASCGGDGTAIIYDAETFNVLHTLREHEDGICSIAWSPDDTMIVTCSKDKHARLWDTATGQCIRELRELGQPVTSCVWAPDGQSFVLGCLDVRMNLCQWGLDGSVIYDWNRPHRIQGLAISPNGTRLVAIDVMTSVHVYNFQTRELEYTLDLKVKLSSVAISEDSKYFLINKTDGQARLYDIETQEPVRAYSGHKGGEFAVRTSFGGANEAFVISGSEDGSVFIWHKENGTLVERLEAHLPTTCNSVSWNPANPSMFASAGDDHKVKIWSNEQLPTGTKPSKRTSTTPVRDSYIRTSAWN